MASVHRISAFQLWHARRIFICHRSGDGDGKPSRIDHFNDALRAEWDLGEVKNVTFKGADDDDVQMWIVYPPNFDTNEEMAAA